MPSISSSMLRMPFVMRSNLHAPKFCAANTENENATWLNSTVASCSTLLPTV